MHKSVKSSVFVPWAKPAHLRSLPNEECVSSRASNPLPTRCINETPYARMLREEEEMDFIFNITVSAANWALLAGYLVVPGTFTSLQSSDQADFAERRRWAIDYNYQRLRISGGRLVCNGHRYHCRYWGDSYYLSGTVVFL
ncbi:hypothetical protein N7494_006977 [Penicillium frequentans]|uniref:Uncharacterized protein n=1 Tax=Penicillium frequentans TaxID=3151616 RepID=A0AAD6CRR4_9EURO|nr:hypothetical protein N7494_006977 [Penicillium glabrum]